MDSHDRRNIQRVIRLLARDWHCPTWRVNLIIQQLIDKNWEISMLYPERKALWDQYFPGENPQRKSIFCGLAVPMKEMRPCRIFLSIDSVIQYILPACCRRSLQSTVMAKNNLPWFPMGGHLFGECTEITGSQPGMPAARLRPSLRLRHRR